MNKRLSLGLKVIVSVFIIAVILYSIDFNELKNIFSNINYHYLYLIILLLPFSIYLRIYRWWYLMNYRQEKKISQSLASRITLAGLALNIFMPAQSGEVLKAYFGYKWSGVKERMFTISLYDKIIAIASVGFLGFIPAVYYSNIWFFAGSLATFLPLLILFAALRISIFRKYSEKISRKLFKNKFDFIKASEQFNFDAKLLSITILLSALGWIAVYVIMWACFELIAPLSETTPSLLFVLMAAPIITLGRLFPFTLNGLGSDEALIVFIFSLAGTSAALSFGAALTYKVITIMIPGIIGLITILTSKGK